MRFALFYKNIDCDFVAVNLLESEQKSAEHHAISPMNFVPVLQFERDGHQHNLFESTAIIEWLDETHPQNRLLPDDCDQRALVRATSQIINAGIQPLQNLQTLDAISTRADERQKWARHWTQKGLDALENVLKTTAGTYSFGDAVCMTDALLVPQLYNARRFQVDCAEYPTLQKIENNLIKLECYEQSHPDRFQPVS